MKRQHEFTILFYNYRYRQENTSRRCLVMTTLYLGFWDGISLVTGILEDYSGCVMVMGVGLG